MCWARSCSLHLQSLGHLGLLGASDGGDHLHLLGFLDVERGHALAQPHHDDPVGHGEHVHQVVADDNDRQPLLAQPADEVQHLPRLGHAERRRGLIQEHHLRLAHHRPRHRDGLALATGQRRHLRPHAGDAHRQPLEQGRGLLLHDRFIQPAHGLPSARRALLAPEEQVAHHVQVIAQREVLIHGGDPQRRGHLRPRQGDLPALEEGVALINGDDPRDDLDQGRLASAVVTTEGNHLTGLDFEVHLGQRLDGSEALGDSLQRKQRIRGHRFPFPALLDLSRRAGVLVGARADLLGLPEAVRHDGGLHVLLRHGDGRQQDGRDVLLAVVHLGVDLALGHLAAQQRHGQLGGGLGLGLDGLVDGHVLLAHQHALDAGQLRVLTGHGRQRVDAGRLHRGDGPAGGAVIGRVHADDLVLAQRGDGLLHLLLSLVRAPVRGVVLGAHHQPAAIQDAVRAGLEELRVVVRGRAVDDDDGALVLAVRLELVEQRLALELADLLVVERDVVVDVRVGDEPVVADDGHLGLTGAGHHGRGGRRVHRVEHQHLRAVGQRRLGLALLLGGVLVRVAVDDLAVRAQLLDLALEVRPVVGLIAGRLRLGQQQGDLPTRTLLRGGGSSRRCFFVLAFASRNQDHHCRQHHRGAHAGHRRASFHSCLPLKK
ncbi:hypothetical protein STIAU_5981 [Stigmatella aurantiaca DW4/3-1]|uniref:Uncharacterized protein n=1 Tax=Stigmatella aurantiaca (strain DW4/3-1) TaxID=378806 RepID=Q08WY8_STIAD|nr:hypothetical protein STIAU_5981 [Stigmatella aurantiaca DW4/3-1]